MLVLITILTMSIINTDKAKNEVCKENGFKEFKGSEKYSYCITETKAIPHDFFCKGLINVKCETRELVFTTKELENGK